MKIKLLLALGFSCTFLFSFSQNFPKWGKLSEQEIKLSVCAFDSNATAVVLADYGKINITYENVTIEHHKRIKILDKKALDRANIAILYFIKDKIEGLDAQTLTIDKNGKVVATAIPKAQLFDVDRTAEWREKRFSFPSIEVGSILEYRYKTISHRYTFPDGWEFQSDIPTLHSELTASIQRQDLDYRVLLQGDRLMTKYEKTGDKPISTWSLDNIPALLEEPYVANRYDYAEKIRFQLAGYNKASSGIYGGSEYTTLMTTWDKLSEELLTSQAYINFLNRGGKAKDILSQIITSKDSDSEKAQKIYAYVRNNFSWNGDYHIFPEQMFGKFLDTKQGNSAEINLLLTLLLQEADLKAAPVLISTRRHGKIQQASPLLTQFNQTLACVTIDSKDILLNATDPLRPYPLLDEQDLNWYALVLEKPQSRWIKIEQATTTKETVYADISLENPTKPLYNFSVRYEGYSAIDTRRKFYKLGEQKFIDQQKGVFTDKKLVKFEQENQDKPSEALLHKYQLELEEVSDNQKQTIYFQPVLWHHFQENPFKGTKRNLPIEMDYPSSFQFILNLRIPDGYQVQELPKATLVTLPDNMGMFRYQATVKDSQLQLFTSVQFKTVFIPAYYYSHLQQFYDQIIGKYQEMIVLKKK